jgi:hypothetical protein
MRRKPAGAVGSPASRNNRSRGGIGTVGRTRYSLPVSRKAWIIVVVGAVAVAAGVTAGLVWVLAHTDSHAAEALTTVTTVMLLILTGGYVALTSRLVRAQERPLQAIRLAAQETKAGELSVMLWSKEIQVYGAKAMLPVVPPELPDVGALAAVASAMGELSTHLASVSSQLPSSFSTRGLDTAKELAVACMHVSGLAWAVETEMTNSEKDARPFDWQRARNQYYSDIRDRLREKPEWDDLLAGARVASVCDQLRAFDYDLSTYLQEEHR